MKKLKIFALAILAMGVCLNLTACSDDDDDSGSSKPEVYKEVTVETPGTLASFVGDDMYEVTSLKISGSLNGDDISCLRLLCDCRYDSKKERSFSLTSLDLSDASIVEGGGSYYTDGSPNYTSNNEIGCYMFYWAEYLEKIILPNSVTSIGEMAFYDCQSLTSINIPEGVTSIGEYAFFGCQSLTSITIPENVTSIEREAFRECQNLSEVYCYATEPPSLGTYAFGDISSYATLCVPNGCLVSYLSSDWASYFSEVKAIN